MKKILALTIVFLVGLSFSIVFALPSQSITTIVSDPAKVFYCSENDSLAACDVTQNLFSGLGISNTLVTQLASTGPSAIPSIITQMTSPLPTTDPTPNIVPTNTIQSQNQSADVTPSVSSATVAVTPSARTNAELNSLDPNITPNTEIPKKPEANVGTEKIATPINKVQPKITPKVCSQTNQAIGATVNTTDLPACESSPNIIALAKSPRPTEVASQQLVNRVEPIEKNESTAGGVLASQADRPNWSPYLFGAVSLISALAIFTIWLKSR